jgi:hypothetical protein
MKVLPLALLLALFPGAALSSGSSGQWRQQYRDLSAIVERAFQAGSADWMRDASMEASKLLGRVGQELPERARPHCAFAAQALANTARSLQQRNLLSAAADRRQWQEMSPLCERALRAGASP